MIAAQQALLDGAIVGPTTIVHDGPRLVGVRDWRPGDPEPLPGALIPGLVNAHLHLELSWAAGQIPAGLGFDGWFAALRGLTPPAEATEIARSQAQLLAARGTVAVCDIANGPGTDALLAEAGLAGVVQDELLTLDRRRLPAQLARAQVPPSRTGGLVRRVGPHATYSTAEALIRAAVGAEGLGHPASIHVAEDPAEAQLLRDGSGPWPARLDALGLDWRPWIPPGRSPVGWLAALGLLGPGLMLVHGVHVDAADIAAIAASGSPLCLCARSNTHVGGRLPPVPALREAGVQLALGTDSLASAPDLDVLGEVCALRQAFPDVPIAAWLTMATAGGADALNLPGIGRLRPGTAPGVLLLAGLDGPSLRERQVLLPAGPVNREDPRASAVERSGHRRPTPRSGGAPEESL